MRLLISSLVFSLGMMAGSELALADGSSAIIARQACMKVNTSAFNVMIPIFKGEKTYDDAVVQKAVHSIDFLCSDWPTFWGKDTRSFPGLNTRVEEAIWTEADAFQKASDVYFASLKSLAATHDEAAFKVGFLALGKACSECHDKFRGPEN